MSCLRQKLPRHIALLAAPAHRPEIPARNRVTRAPYPGVTQLRNPIIYGACAANRALEPGRQLFDLIQLQWLGAFFLCGM